MDTVEAVPLTRAAGVGIELVRKGRGRPLLFLHPHIGHYGAAQFIERLAAGAEVIAPVHPGFGASELPAHFTSVDDLAYFYLDVIEEMDLRGIALVGASLGAWIALEMAIKSTARIASLTLIGAVGAKFGPREKGDIVDIFSTPRARLEELSYHDARFARSDLGALPDPELEVLARNWETTARYAWTPYMHDPKLRGRLHRVHVPALVLSGAQDRIAPLEHGRHYAAAIPGARFEEIPDAGHFAYVEQPEAAAALVAAHIGKPA